MARFFVRVRVPSTRTVVGTLGIGLVLVLADVEAIVEREISSCGRDPSAVGELEAMTTKWEDDGRRAVMQDFAEAAHADGDHFFYVRIPGDIQPLEREERFEQPLELALQESGLGSVTGGGSQLGEGTTVEYCGLDVVVSERARAIALIRSVMQSVGCPLGAVLEEYLPEYSELPIWLD